MRCLAVFCLFAVLQPATAVAGGRYEINQLCVSSGCFAGDAPGFPIEISQSGSYRLTSNLVTSGGQALDAVIDIQAPQVSLDLSGFTVGGPTNCSGSPPVCLGTLVDSGIRVTGAARVDHVMIENGTVEGFNESCVSIEAEVLSMIVRDLGISHCREHGVSSLAPGRVEGVNVNVIGESGIFAPNALVLYSVVNETGSTGIFAESCTGNQLNRNGNGSTIDLLCPVQIGGNSCSGALCPDI
ncbi:hypothetical protein [Halomonas denitrificans]|nr:hypothetical protein [Halomonas denitrificans]